MSIKCKFQQLFHFLSYFSILTFSRLQGPKEAFEKCKSLLDKIWQNKKRPLVLTFVVTAHIQDLSQITPKIKRKCSKYLITKVTMQPALSLLSNSIQCEQLYDDGESNNNKNTSAFFGILAKHFGYWFLVWDTVGGKRMKKPACTCYGDFSIKQSWTTKPQSISQWMLENCYILEFFSLLFLVFSDGRFVAR